MGNKMIGAIKKNAVHDLSVCPQLPMANGDYGYFGKGDTGYAQYMTAFNRNFGGSSGGGGGGGDGSGCGCLIAIAVVVVLVLLAMGS